MIINYKSLDKRSLNEKEKNIIDGIKDTGINEIVSEAIQGIRTDISRLSFDYSNIPLGTMLRERINSGMENILKFKQYCYNSKYFIKDSYVIIYKRNSYYVNEKIIAKCYKSIKKFIENYDTNNKQMEFDFGDIEKKVDLNDKTFFLLFLDFNLADLKNDLDKSFYNLYFLTIENEEITTCVDITARENISKVYDTTSSQKKTDINSEIPTLKRKSGELIKIE